MIELLYENKKIWWINMNEICTKMKLSLFEEIVWLFILLLNLFDFILTFFLFLSCINLINIIIIIIIISLSFYIYSIYKTKILYKCFYSFKLKIQKNIWIEIWIENCRKTQQIKKIVTFELFNLKKLKCLARIKNDEVRMNEWKKERKQASEKGPNLHLAPSRNHQNLNMINNQ